ncbi:hypothetical protein [Kitasatospora sp. SolWspMP-SS2h]|uniref:hypothetical protein n=1 Tax=Kitasatospora sp. SolWspMP-SS2h TaxID=1305729 RepID=UPI0011B948A5|nr:hypothetical protein [Kitasatospora sp. SolWspMP-SS2h]
MVIDITDFNYVDIFVAGRLSVIATAVALLGTRPARTGIRNRKASPVGALWGDGALDPGSKVGWRQPGWSRGGNAGKCSAGF